MEREQLVAIVAAILAGGRPNILSPQSIVSEAGEIVAEAERQEIARWEGVRAQQEAARRVKEQERRDSSRCVHGMSYSEPCPDCAGRVPAPEGWGKVCVHNVPLRDACELCRAAQPRV